MFCGIQFFQTITLGGFSNLAYRQAYTKIRNPIVEKETAIQNST